MPTVLLVDDNLAVTEIIRALLQRNSYSVHVTNSPEAAIALLAHQKVDIIVSDVMMPNVDGFELGRRIRAEARTASIPIIYLTALDSMEDEFEAWLSGADAYMVKPFKARDLLNNIENVLAGKGRALSSSNGRLNALNDNVRALAAISAPLLGRVSEASREAGLNLEVCRDFDDAFKRLDRGKFGLLICDAGLPKFSVRAVSEYMRYFALNIPVLLLGAQDQSEPRFMYLTADAGAETIAQMLRDCLQRTR